MSKTVSEYLNEIDYEKLKDYKPSSATLEFINFIQMCEDGQTENKTPVVHLVALDKAFSSKKAVSIMCHRGFAKCLDINTKINTPYGYKLMRDIKVGDIIFDRNMQTTKVIHISDTFTDKKCYKITLRDGSSFICSHDHNHIVQRRVTERIKGTKKKINVWREFVKTTDELISEGIFHKRTISWRNPNGREAKWFIPISNKAIKYEKITNGIDPYTFGCFLGDGNFKSCRLIGHKDDIFELASYIPYEINHIHHRNVEGKENVYSLSYNSLRSSFKFFLQNYNNFVKDNKFIPDNYLYSDFEDRVAILQGLMDTDGTVTKDGHLSFTNMSKTLCDNMLALIKSIGGTARLRNYEINNTTYYEINFNLPKDILPFKLKRKLERYIQNPHYAPERLSIQGIEEVESIPTKCISVDSPTHSYIFNDGYITHNTTLFAEMLFLFIACFGRLPGSKDKVNFALYIADSIDNGVKSLRKNMEFRYQNSEFLKRMIPNTTVKYSDENGDDVDVTAGRKFTDVRIEFANVRGDHFVLRLYGAKTGVRGAKELGVRPQLAIIDDIISDEDARSETVIASIEDVIHKAVKYALHPKKHKVIWLGTPFNANDPLYKAVESGSYEVACFPVCEKFPCTKEEFRGSWEDRFDYEYVKASYEEALGVGKVDSFYQELMLQIMSDENRIVRDEDIVWFEKNEVLKYKHNYNFYITTDFATSEKSSADYSVISVWGINNNGDYLLVDGVCKQQLMDKNIDDLFVLASVYKPLGVGIEVSGQQKGFVSWIQSEMVKRNVFFNLVSSNNNGQPGIRPVADKFARFNLFLPRIKTKKLWMPKELKDSAWMNEFIDEISKASISGFKSKHDDVLDTISMLASFDVYKPSANYQLGKEYARQYLPPQDDDYVSSVIF